MPTPAGSTTTVAGFNAADAGGAATVAVTVAVRPALAMVNATANATRSARHLVLATRQPFLSPNAVRSRRYT